jgi:hypothetical protein
MDYTKEVETAITNGEYSKARMAVGQMFRMEGVTNSYPKIAHLVEDSGIWNSDEEDLPVFPSTKADAEEELKNQLAALTIRFSRGRMNYILQLDEFINPQVQQTISANTQQQPVTRVVEVKRTTRVVTTQQKVGMGVAAVGAVATVVGVATSTTALTVGGVVGMVAGAALYLSDRGE